VQVADSVYTDRLIAALSTAFGVLALALTAVGLYGVIAYVVSRRGAEIGIRMALGAVRGDIVWLVMREVCLLTAGGTAVGLAGAAAAGRAVESQLFGVRGLDPAIFVAVPLTLAAVALAAGCVPAVRASRTDPMDALRHE
jgi:ABC-type antimicrobial peptide transport system permease subunit